MKYIRFIFPLISMWAVPALAENTQAGICASDLIECTVKTVIVRGE